MSSATGQQPPAATPPLAQTTIETHQAAVDLVEASGAREAMASKIDEIVVQSNAELKKHSPNASETYYTECSKRFKAGLNLDDYMAVIVHVYESHFTASELHELVQATRDGKAGKPVVISDTLKGKLGAQMTTVQSEIMGGCSQLGAKLGGDIDVALHKEHPEWFPATRP